MNINNLPRGPSVSVNHSIGVVEFPIVVDVVGLDVTALMLLVLISPGPLCPDELDCY